MLKKPKSKEEVGKIAKPTINKKTLMNIPEGLTTNQEMFCQYYVSKEFFANGTDAYAGAYGFDLVSNPKDVSQCAVGANRLLKDTKILLRINELIDLTGLNDEYVDKQLLFAITQNADLNSKVQAIKEYNNLRNRIQKKQMEIEIRNLKNQMEENNNITIKITMGDQEIT